MFKNFYWNPFGDNSALIKCNQSISNPRNEGYIMFNDHKCRTHVIAQTAHHRCQSLDLSLCQS